MNESAFQIISATLVAENEVVLHPLVGSQSSLASDLKAFCLATAQTNVLEHEPWQPEATPQQADQKFEGTAAEQVERGAAHLFDHELRYLSSEGNELDKLELDGMAIVGKTLWEVFPSETCQQLEPLYRNALAGRVLVKEVIHNCQIYQVQTVPVRNGQGQVFTGMACIQNITGRRQAEIALRQITEFKQRMVESSNDCMKVLDLDGRLLFMNARGRCQMEIDDFESVRNAEWPTFWQGDERLDAEAAVVDAKAGGTKQFRGYCPTAKGTPKWWDVVVTPIQDADGSVVQLLSVLRDITEHKQAETALQEHAKYTQLLYETTRDLLSTTQPLTLIETVFNKLKALLGLDFYLNYIVDEGQQQLQLAFYGGISSDAAREIEWLEVGHPIGGTAVQQRRQIVHTDVQHSDDPKVSWLRSLGVTAYVCQPLIAQGKLFGTLGFGSCTCTQFTALERNLFQAICDQIAIAVERSQLVSSLRQQTEELLRASRTKDEFLAVLSHELRTPLSSILGWSHLLQMKQVSPERVQQGVAIIERSARQQAQLIEDLLDIARIIQGKLSLDLTKVDLTDPVTTAVETVRLAAEAKSIQLKVLLDPAVKSIRGDAGRLQQVFCNLLSNAIKFTPVNGQIEVKLEIHKFSDVDSPVKNLTQHSGFKSQPAQSFAQLTVKDTGKGIESEFLPYVFELFRQQDSSTTRHYGGLGLGLAIAYQVVEAHGGTISAASAGEGQGSTFTVRLPLIASPRPDSPSPFQCQSHNLKKLRVMVVDDDVAILELIQTFLEQEGMLVSPMSSSTEALEILTQSPFDLLISDIGMPEMDGYTLIHKVRALAPQFNRDIPALALTAYAGKNNQYQALAAGFQTHLAKPIHPQQLLNEIVQLTTR